MDNHVVIMAGGIGSRFWPMSTPECPKQFIDVMGWPVADSVDGRSFRRCLPQGKYVGRNF